MTQSIVIFILIAVAQAVAGYYAKKAKEKQAAAEAAGRGEGSGVGAAPSLDGTRPVQVNSVRPMNADQAKAVARLIEQRNVVEAVMALRAICNLGLAEARDVVTQFPARGFPADLVSLPAASAEVPAAAAAPPPPPIDNEDPEAASQEGDAEESNDAKHSLASVRAAVDQVRDEVQGVVAQAMRAAGINRPAEAPIAPRVPAPPAPPSVRPIEPVKPAVAVTAQARPEAPRSGRRAVHRGAVAESVVGLLRTRQGARQALLMAEILGPPRAFKPLR